MAIHRYNCHFSSLFSVLHTASRGPVPLTVEFRSFKVLSVRNVSKMLEDNAWPPLVLQLCQILSFRFMRPGDLHL